MKAFLGRILAAALRSARASRHALVQLVASLLTPLVEKNPAKVMTTGARVVFSMSRLIVLAFAIAMIRQVWRHGVTGWPEAVVIVAVILAIPLLSALDRVDPEKVIALGGVLLNRFGVGAPSPAPRGEA